MSAEPALSARPAGGLPLEPARDLSRWLGDPLAGEGPFSYAQIVRHEEAGRLPPGAIELLDEWGLADYLVPATLGGRLVRLEELFFVCRELVRRNATCALRFGSAYLGANPVWLWGSDEQQELVAAGLLGGELAGFAVSEREHGSDLRASDTIAREHAGGYVLNGAKWPIGNATHARFLSVLARHERPGRYSFLLVDKEAAPAGACEPLPAIRTVGLRGHDLSGVRFTNLPLSADAVIGRPGNALARMLMSIQITKVLIGAMSLGSMDAALGIGLLHADTRRLYGSSLWALPMVREELLGAQLDLLIAECMAIPAIRAVSTCSSRLSLWSSVVKYAVTTLGEGVMASMTRVLGAQSYLREGLAGGVFQKVVRDHAVFSIFEGTTHVSLHGIAAQLGAVAAAGESTEATVRLRELFNLSAPSPPWDPRAHRLQLSNEGADEITTGWGRAVESALELARTTLETPAREDLTRLLVRLDKARRTFYAPFSEGGPDPASVAGAAAAREHCQHHAAAACLLMWVHNQTGGSGTSATWLLPCLQRVLLRLGEAVEIDGAWTACLEADLRAAAASGERLTVATPLGLDACSATV